MRVIAGKLGGRQFNAPEGRRTHPMSEKMRGALFGVLGSIDGLTVLDAFAGSGALSIEAISRGAKHVVAIEHDTPAFKVIMGNLEALDLKDDIKAVRANANGWSNNNLRSQFDIVICDPPYDDIRPDLLSKLIRHLKSDGLFVLSWPGKEKPREFETLSIVKNSLYGDSQLVFYKKTG
jgi:16S rRNA (guanine966-N2)-methyltransferase